MGVNDQFALQTSWIAHVRFGSISDIGVVLIYVRFTPESGHQALMSTRPSTTLADF
jgi:hypothetical protein